MTFLRKTYERPARPARALIAMVSKGPGSETALAAARHHAREMRHIWLLTTISGRDDAERISNIVKAEMPQVNIHQTPYLRDAHTVIEVMEAVENARRTALSLDEVDELDLVCDYTGLTKHASAGMVLACAERSARLEFVPALTSDERARGCAPGAPVEVEVAFELSEPND